MSGTTLLGPFDDRVAAELPEGFVVGRSMGECLIAQGDVVHGVSRHLGEQEWSDSHGHRLTVIIEDFDLDAAGLRNWSTGVE